MADPEISSRIEPCFLEEARGELLDLLIAVSLRFPVKALDLLFPRLFVES